MHVDIPTRAEIEELLGVTRPGCVSIYLPTTPLTQEAQGDRIAFKNQAASVVGQLREGGASREDVAAIEESLDDLVDDDDFWALQANSLAVFATPDRVRTFRLPSALTAAVSVADRFHVKPLLRAVTFPQAAFVLALAQGSVRLLEVAADVPVDTVQITDFPASVAGAVRKASIADRSASGRIQGDEGQKVRMGQYARAVDRALRPVLAGLDLPLVLAAAPPLDAIFRAVNSSPHLAEEGIRGNPEAVPDGELAAAARPILDGLYAAELSALGERFAARSAQGRTLVEVGDVARAATLGAVDTVFVDIDAHVPGVVDADTGRVTLAEDSSQTYGVIDEIARRVVLAGGRVVAVRSDEVPGDGPAAAILRYSV